MLRKASHALLPNLNFSHLNVFNTHYSSILTTIFLKKKLKKLDAPCGVRAQFPEVMMICTIKCA